MVSTTAKWKWAALALVVTAWCAELILLAITMAWWVVTVEGLVRKFLTSVLGTQSGHSLEASATVIAVLANLALWFAVNCAFMSVTFRVLEWGQPSTSNAEPADVQHREIDDAGSDSNDVGETVDSPVQLTRHEGCHDITTDFDIAASIYNEGMRIGREIFTETYTFGNSDEVFMKTYREGLELLRATGPSTPERSSTPPGVIDGEVVEVVELEQRHEPPAREQ